jgi:hypothetical protein
MSQSAGKVLPLAASSIQVLFSHDDLIALVLNSFQEVVGVVVSRVIAQR